LSRFKPLFLIILGGSLLSLAFSEHIEKDYFPSDPLEEALLLPEDVSKPETENSSSAAIPSTGSEINADSLFAGLPRVSKKICKDYLVLENDSYQVGYCKSRKIPLWSAYRLFKVDKMQTPGKRPPYKDDVRTGVKLGSTIYSKTGYDAGHLAPNAGIYNRYGRSGQLETFFLSNFGPQTPRLNRGPWRSLEHFTNTEYAQKFEEIWIIAGPILKDGLPLIKGKVPIAEEYFKIIVDIKDGQPRAMGFIMPNSDRMGTALDRHFTFKKRDDESIGYAGLSPFLRDIFVIIELNSFLVSIDQIESRSGLDFYTQLSEEDQDSLESVIPDKVW